MMGLLMLRGVLVAMFTPPVVMRGPPPPLVAVPTAWPVAVVSGREEMEAPAFNYCDELGGAVSTFGRWEPGWLARHSL